MGWHILPFSLWRAENNAAVVSDTRLALDSWMPFGTSQTCSIPKNWCSVSNMCLSCVVKPSAMWMCGILLCPSKQVQGLGLRSYFWASHSVRIWLVIGKWSLAYNLPALLRVFASPKKTIEWGVWQVIGLTVDFRRPGSETFCLTPLCCRDFQKTYPGISYKRAIIV